MGAEADPKVISHNQRRTAMQMRLLATTTLVSISVLILSPANAQTQTGSTLQAGTLCWKATDQGRGFGYWAACDRPLAVQRGRAVVVINRDGLDSFASANPNRGTIGTNPGT